VDMIEREFHHIPLDPRAALNWGPAPQCKHVFYARCPLPRAAAIALRVRRRASDTAV
jgi:hypothetical protein